MVYFFGKTFWGKTFVKVLPLDVVICGWSAFSLKCIAARYNLDHKTNNQFNNILTVRPDVSCPLFMNHTFTGQNSLRQNILVCPLLYVTQV